MERWSKHAPERTYSSSFCSPPPARVSPALSVYLSVVCLSVCLSVCRLSVCLSVVCLFHYNAEPKLVHEDITSSGMKVLVYASRIVSVLCRVFAVHPVTGEQAPSAVAGAEDVVERRPPLVSKTWGIAALHEATADRILRHEVAWAQCRTADGADDSGATFGSISVSGLAPATSYFYAVELLGKCGQKADCFVGKFTTAAAAVENVPAGE